MHACTPVIRVFGLGFRLFPTIPSLANLFPLLRLSLLFFPFDILFTFSLPSLAPLLHLSISLFLHLSFVSLSVIGNRTLSQNPDPARPRSLPRESPPTLAALTCWTKLARLGETPCSCGQPVVLTIYCFRCNPLRSTSILPGMA